MKEGDEEEKGKGGWGGVVVTNKVRGQVIKSVRLLATSSNLKEFINALGQACGSANQLSNRCLVRAILPMTRKRQNE